MFEFINILWSVIFINWNEDRMTVKHSIKFKASLCQTLDVSNSKRMHPSGLKITAGQRTMSGLIEALTGQTFDLPVMLTGQN